MKYSLAVVLLCMVASYATAQRCSSQTDAASCNKVEGCSFTYNNNDKCVSDFQCFDAFNETSCNKKSNCTWSNFACNSVDFCFVNNDNKDACEKTTGCKYDESGFCGQDSCDSKFSKDQCDSAVDKDGVRTCSYEDSSESSCDNYSPCKLISDRMKCVTTKSCQWSTECTDATFVDGADCYVYDNENDCKDGKRSELNRSTGCLWIIRDSGFCSDYDPCSNFTTKESCDENEDCAFMENECITSYGTGISSTGSVADCDEVFTKSECLNLTNRRGGQKCSFVERGETDCVSACQFITTEEACSKNPTCVYDFGCEQNSSIQDNCVNLLPDQCESAGDACAISKQTDNSCEDYSPCYEIQNETDCANQTNCEFDTFESYCKPGKCGSGSGLSSSSGCVSGRATRFPTERPEDPSCFDYRTKDACGYNETLDLNCTWLESFSTYCDNYSPCTNVDNKNDCNKIGGCEWVGSCFTGADATLPPGSDDISCFSYTAANTCNMAGRNTTSDPQICTYFTNDNSYCVEAAPCVGGLQSTQQGCDGTPNCWWDAYADGQYDGVCNEGKRPPSTTTITMTTQTTTPPPPTPFSCDNSSYRCPGEDKCIPLNYLCDKVNDCNDKSDESYEKCPTQSRTSTTATPGECKSYEFKCANRECVLDFAGSKKCNGKPECSDGSDEIGCPTKPPSPSPTIPTPTTSTPTSHPSASPTSSPTPTPKCYVECNSNIATIYEATIDPKQTTPASCRACVDDFISVAAFCKSLPYPPSNDCPKATPSPVSSDVKLTLYFASSIPLTDEFKERTELHLRQQFELSATAISQTTLTKVDDDTYEMDFVFTQQSTKQKISQTLKTQPLQIPARGNEPAVQMYETLDEAVNPKTKSPVTSSPTSDSGDKPGSTDPPTTADSDKNKKADDSGDNSVTYVIIIIVAFLLIAGIIIFVVVRWKKKKASGTAKTSRQVYENPAYASSTPPWADPNVPFMGREEAEAKLRSSGMQDGEFVVRQTTNVPRGYVITTVRGGQFTNLQLKNNDGVLTYGGRSVGSNLNEALKTMKTSVQVQPKQGAPFFLGDNGLEFEADA